MGEGRQSPGLATEALGVVGPVGPVLTEELESDTTLELAVRGLVHHAHPPAAEGSLEPVPLVQEDRRERWGRLP